MIVLFIYRRHSYLSPFGFVRTALSGVLFSTLSLQLLTSLQANSAGSPQIWNDLRAKREALKSFHQEFEISRTFKTTQHNQASKWSVVLDCTARRWRERSMSGTGDHITMFDGADLFEFEDGADEYQRLKHSSKEEAPQPDPYSAMYLDLSKAVELARQSCGLTNVDHECIVIDVPVKPWMRNAGGKSGKMMGGVTRLNFDTVTGLLISSHTVQNVDDGRSGYQLDIAYLLKRMSYNGEADESLFLIPSGVTREVKELSRWNADKIKKQLAGKTAPDLALTDIRGKTMTVSDLKGRTVLLEFWATWCGPCRADGPSLDKLYGKYGGTKLSIIAVSVNEERTIVEKFLTEHPHEYPVALTTENEMPRPYQIGVLPTYIIINSEGNLVFATEGEKGFSELRRMLKKAGLDTD